MSLPNYDAEAGIHYGFIYQNSVGSGSVSSIYDNGTDVGYQNAKAEAKKSVAAIVDEINALIGEFMSDVEKVLDKADFIDKVAFMANAELNPEPLDSEQCWDGVEQDWNDSTQDMPSGPYRYEKNGYVILTDSDNTELIVCQSPYFTYCRECSPCAPNGGYLKSQPGSMKTYCLGADWFDEYAPLPYSVYSAETGEIVAKWKGHEEEENA